ncbi:hypothetical protein PV383_38375 [Streptomyces caniscabiei]|uniref:DUF2637 domain-containing protein n=1 Tax=Streptomyces caniscabiei TaxID=2746961 RepID=A0ABU4N1P6_9ACTN|nr:hypothetical protein [Streptomyces caniscabiei]MDX2946800.1 hypothetical protein [Streptomyces caniscabiei]MDX3043004.1 hypothetical protein [Streptomyces caniscabiei]
MKRDPLLWAALVAVLVVLASAEYRLAVACGFGQYVAAGVPAALDVYALAALRARRDVLAVVAVLIGVNAASHLVEVGLLPVDVPLVVAVSAVAPLVLWRVHRLGEVAAAVGNPTDEASAELAPEPSSTPAEPAEPITVEREPAAVSTVVDAAPVGPVLGPWTPLAELAAGTGGTVIDLRLPQGYRAAGPFGGTEAEPAAEPVPPAVPPTGTGAADIVSEDSQNTTFEARVALVRTWLVTEPELTGTEIGTRLGVSDGYGRRVLRSARDGS